MTHVSNQTREIKRDALTLTMRYTRYMILFLASTAKCNWNVRELQITTLQTSVKQRFERNKDEFRAEFFDLAKIWKPSDRYLLTRLINLLGSRGNKALLNNEKHELQVERGTVFFSFSSGRIFAVTLILPRDNNFQIHVKLMQNWQKCYYVESVTLLLTMSLTELCFYRKILYKFYYFHGFFFFFL